VFSGYFFVLCLLGPSRSSSKTEEAAGRKGEISSRRAGSSAVSSKQTEGIAQWTELRTFTSDTQLPTAGGNPGDKAEWDPGSGRTAASHGWNSCGRETSTNTTEPAGETDFLSACYINLLAFSLAMNVFFKIQCLVLWLHHQYF